MTRADAQLLYDWLIATYGDPSEPSTSKTFVKRDAYCKRDGDASRDRKSRMRRQEYRQDRNQDDRA